MEQINNIEITNPNRVWVVQELDKLYAQWVSWQSEVASIVDQPFDRNTQSSVFLDGENNMLKHEVLQAKTLTFLNNNVKGHGFIEGFNGQHVDRTDLRLAVRVKHRIHELDMLRASLEYAKVPEGYWKQKGKQLIDKLAHKTGDAAINIAASYLKNPMSGE